MVEFEKFISELIENRATTFSFLEVVGIPLMFFFMIFYWRDKSRVPHIPFSDFVALLAVADFAAGVDPIRVTRLLSTNGRPFLTPLLHWHFFMLSCVGFLVCRVLILVCERKLAPILIYHMDVGIHQGAVPTRAGGLQAIRQNAQWRSYNMNWATSVALVSMFVSLHWVSIGNTFSWGSLRLPATVTGQTCAILIVGMAALVSASVVNFILTLSHFYRFDVFQKGD